MEKKVKLSALLQFILLAKTEGWNPQTTLKQIELFARGNHDSSLSDMAIVLLDGSE